MSEATAEPKQHALQQVSGQAYGLEEVEPSDLSLPYLILTQGLSKFVTQEDHKVGVFVNTLSKKEFATVDFIPFKLSKYINLLKPEGGKMVFEARATDDNDPRLAGRRFFAEGKGDSRIAANATSIIAILALVNGEPAVIKFAKSGYKTGKDLLTMAKMSGGAFWSHKYQLGAKKETKGENTFYVPTVKDLGATSEDEQAPAWAMYNNFADKAKNVVDATQDGEPYNEQEQF
mgnify:CR=1 FL=1